MKTDSYAFCHPAVLDPRSRLRIAGQIAAVLRVQMGGKALKTCRLLDVGCSSGIIANYLRQYTSSVTGIDTDEEAIALAQKKFRRKNLHFLNMNAMNMSFGDNKFDVVVCNQVYACVDKPGALFAEIFRVLAPGGICFLAVQNREIGLFWHLQRLCCQFTIHRYTAEILHNPRKYNFKLLAPWQELLKFIPISIWERLEPVIPNIIWLLEKPKKSLKKDQVLLLPCGY